MSDLKPHIEHIKAQVDLHDLAEQLGLKRGKGQGANYHSPHHDDANPSLSIFNGGRAWKDFSQEDAGGSCFDLVQYVQGGDFMAALSYLEQLYGYQRPRKDQPGPYQDGIRRQSTEEWIAQQCIANAERAIPYLKEERKIPEHIIQRAIESKALGFNDYVNPKAQYGDHNYGGDSVTFIVRTLNPGRVVALDHRFTNPAANGGVKTKTKGEKDGHPWYINLQQLQRAHTVYVCESSINALTIEAAGMPGAAAIALRGTGNVHNIDWRFLAGKRVIAVLDFDQPDSKGHCPGQKAMWALHEQLLALNTACLSIEQYDWPERGINDINDLLQLEHAEGVRMALKKLEPHLIPGKPGNTDQELGRTRVWLPPHDQANYWRFRVKEDFTSFVKKEVSDEETGEKRTEYTDVCGFRVAGLARVKIASATAATTGESDAQPQMMFAVSVQTPRHGPQLVRKVFRDEELHNVDRWRKFGPIYAPQPFMRMLNIMERTADIGSRDAINFVGLAWREGKPVLNEGPDCYFTDPEKQCPYHALLFPSGTTDDARQVLEAYHRTFGNNAALLALVWGLGAHLKAFLGFWPHLEMQARKGAGKTTLLKRMESTIGFTMFGSEQVKTDFRQLTTVSHTSHPVGWEEFSTIPQRFIDAATSILQQAYQFAPTTRGSEMTQYLISAPVLLAGEDVPVRSIIGKLIRTDLREQGAMLPDDLPKFPVREWINYLTGFTRQAIKEGLQQAKDDLQHDSCATGKDAGSRRMMENYAAILLAWRHLAAFTGIAKETGRLEHDLAVTMNHHISETEADREPWVWILEAAMNQIDRNEYRFPWKVDSVEKRHTPTEVERRDCLIIRHTHIMDQLRHTPALRPTFDGLPVKTANVFKQQLLDAGVIWMEDVERTINDRRWARMMALDLERLDDFGLTVPVFVGNGGF